MKIYNKIKLIRVNREKYISRRLLLVYVGDVFGLRFYLLLGKV